MDYIRALQYQRIKMSEQSRSLESTRHCMSDRKPKGTIIYVVVAAVAVIIGSLSGRHENPVQPKMRVAKLLAKVD